MSSVIALSLFLFLFLASARVHAAISGSQTASASTTSDPEVPEVVGKVIMVKGKVWISSQAGASLASLASLGKQEPAKVELKEDGVIHSNDLILTGPDGQVKLVLGDKIAAILIKKDSIIRFTQTPDKDWVLDLAQGTLLSYVRHEKLDQHRFQIKSKSALMGVRGTTFFIKDLPGKDLYLCTCDGFVTADQSVIVGKNHSVPKWITSGNKPIGQRMKTAPVDPDHTPEETKALVLAVQ